MINKTPTILFTGGGSAGHVTPNIALINKFVAQGWQVFYIGSRQGIESNIIRHLNIPFFGITTGKLRRYFSWHTFREPFAIMLGIIQAFKLCRRLKPQVVFSKGGFVSFPVVVAAWLNRIPVVIHESDLTPGLANKLSFPFARKICVTFEEGKHKLALSKVTVTGTPIREALLQGSAQKGRDVCQFLGKDPVILVIGGGQGAAIINQTLRGILPNLLDKFQIAHICGKGKMDNSFTSDRYKQFEYLHDELADVFACADLVISRAGANSLYELLSLKKPHILIPLSRKASRGDQIVNAEYFAKKGLSKVLYEEDLKGDSLLGTIQQVYSKKEEFSQRLLDFSLPDSNQLIYLEIINAMNNKPMKDTQ